MPLVVTELDMSEFTAVVTAKAAVYRFRSSLCGDGESLSLGQVAEVKGRVHLAVNRLHVSRDDDTVQINVIKIRTCICVTFVPTVQMDTEKMKRTEDGDRD